MNGPRFDVGPHLLPGLVAVALFLVFASVFAGAAFGEPAGFDRSLGEVNLDDQTEEDFADVTTTTDEDGTVAQLLNEEGNVVDTVRVSEESRVNVDVVTRDGDRWAIVSVSIVEAIGYSLIGGEYPSVGGESFLAALIIVALVLDGALDGAVHLARREDRPTAAESGGEME